MATKSRYKVFTATTEHPAGEWVEYYLRTSGDIVENGVTGTHNYITAGQYVSASLVALDTAVKAAYDHVPANVLTSDSTLNAANLDGKVPEACLPDYILGQLLYGGVLEANASANLSSSGKKKLGITSALVHSVTLNTNAGMTTYGYMQCQGMYFIVSTAQTFANISLNVGDWLLSTGAGWAKVDNTDAISLWCGLAGNITTAQAKTALGGSIASGNDGFVTGGAVYTALYVNDIVLSGRSIKTGTDYNILYYDGEYGINIGESQNNVPIAVYGDSCTFYAPVTVNSTVFGASFNSGLVSDNNSSMYQLAYMVSQSDSAVSIGGMGTDDDANLLFKASEGGFTFKNTATTGGTTDNCFIKFVNNSGSVKINFYDIGDDLVYDIGDFALNANVPTITSSNSAPSSPKTGDIWIDTSN